MYVYDTPDVGQAASEVLIVANGEAATAPRQMLGICDTVFVDPSNEENKVDAHFVVDAQSYFGMRGRPLHFADPTVKVVRQPKHGQVLPNPNWKSGNYVVKPGYEGKDTFIVEVREGAVSVRVQYFITTTSDRYASSCQGSARVISTSTPSDLAAARPT